MREDSAAAGACTAAARPSSGSALHPTAVLMRTSRVCIQSRRVFHRCNQVPVGPYWASYPVWVLFCMQKSKSNSDRSILSRAVANHGCRGASCNQADRQAQAAGVGDRTAGCIARGSALINTAGLAFAQYCCTVVSAAKDATRRERVQVDTAPCGSAVCELVATRKRA